MTDTERIDELERRVKELERMTDRHVVSIPGVWSVSRLPPSTITTTHGVDTAIMWGGYPITDIH